MSIIKTASRYRTGVILLMLSALADAAMAGGAGCGDRCVKVKVAVAQVATLATRVVLTGDIEAKFQSNIAFRISGKIASRKVDIGDHVTRDQILATLDPQDQKSNLDTTTAALASANALLAQAKVGFQRQQTLFQQGFTTKSSYDQAQQSLQQQRAAVASAEAALGTAREQLSYTNLVAGADGIVVARNAETGQVVQAGTTVFTVAQDGPRDAVFDIYEALLAKSSPQLSVDVALNSDLSVRTVGRVREVSPNVDPNSGAVRVKVQLDRVPGRMTLGAAVLGSAAVTSDAVVVLPTGALFYWNRQPAVWVVDNASRVKIQTIRIDRFADDTFSVTSGVTPGTRVVTAGIQFLYPGQQVDVAAGARS